MIEPPGPHDPDGLVMAALVGVCPSFADVWARHRAEWDAGGTDRAPYVDVGVFATHLVGLLERGATSEFDAVFSQVERLLEEGDPGVRYLTTVGFLESIGNVASNRHGWPWAEGFATWFGTETKVAWDQLHDALGDASRQVTFPQAGRHVRGYARRVLPRFLCAVIAVVTLAGCATPAPSLVPSPLPTRKAVPESGAWGDTVATPAPEAVANQPILGRTERTITVLPISPTGAAIGVAYSYVTPHCGLNGPIDVDGSFWDMETTPADSALFDGEPGRFELLSGDEALFVGQNGQSVWLRRHVGAMTVPLCG